jgi:hypothetical protein
METRLYILVDIAAQFQAYFSLPTLLGCPPFLSLSSEETVNLKTLDLLSSNREDLMESLSSI